MTPLPPHGSLRRRSVLRALGVAASRLALPGGLGGAPGWPVGRARRWPPRPSSPPSSSAATRTASSSATPSTSTSGTAADEALVKAVPLFFVAEAEIFRDRWYWRDRRVAAYGAGLEDRLPAADVDVSGDDRRRPEPELSDARDEALVALSRSARWKIADPGQIEDGRHYLEFNYRLDTVPAAATDADRHQPGSPTGSSRSSARSASTE